MNEVDVGYILSVTPYREYDAMVHFLGEKYGLMRLVLAGFYKPNSKQARLGVEFSKVRIRFKYRDNALLRIQSGELLDAFLDKRQDYDWLTYRSLCAELLVKLYQPASKEFWLNFVNSSFDDLSLENLLYNLSLVIQDLGITPIVDRCVITGSKEISDFSIEKGGFVSKAYRNSKLTLKQLQVILFHFKTGLKPDIEIENIERLLDLYLRYIEYHMDVKFNSWKLIYDV